MSELRIVDTVIEYVVIGEPWMTPAQVVSLCCDSVEIPECEEKTEPWGGYSQKEILEQLGITLDDEGRDGDGNYVEVMLRKPPSGTCGDQVTRVEKNQLRCCDYVDPLVWDYDKTGDVMGQSGSMFIFIDGGRAPFEVKVRGNGFYLDENYSVTNAILDGMPFEIFTTPAACGSCAITVKDGCTDVKESIRSTVGRWEARDPVGCEEAGLGIVDSDDLTGGYTMTVTVIIGAFRYSQGWSMQGSSPTPEICYDPDISGCGTTIVPFPQRGRCQSTYGGPQSEPNWFAKNENSPDVGNNISCGWGTYEGRCETIGVEEWVC